MTNGVCVGGGGVCIRRAYGGAHWHTDTERPYRQHPPGAALSLQHHWITGLGAGWGITLCVCVCVYDWPALSYTPFPRERIWSSVSLKNEGWMEEVVGGGAASVTAHERIPKRVKGRPMCTHDSREKSNPCLSVWGFFFKGKNITGVLLH